MVEAIELAEFRHREGNGLFSSGGIGGVPGDEAGILTQLFERLGTAFGIAADNDQLGAFGNQGLGGREAHAGGAADHDDGKVLQT